MSSVLVVCDSVDSGISKVVRSSRNASSYVRCLAALTLVKASKMSDPGGSLDSAPRSRVFTSPGHAGPGGNCCVAGELRVRGFLSVRLSPLEGALFRGVIFKDSGQACVLLSNELRRWRLGLEKGQESQL